MRKVIEERIRLTASFFNIAGAGLFVGATLTEPLAYVTSGRVDPFMLTNFILISFGGAVLLHLGAQAILGLLDP